MAKQTKDVRQDYLPPDKYLNLKEVRRMREFAKKEGDRARRNGTKRGLTDELIVEIMLATAVRSEELCHINLSDLPTHHGKDLIYVRKQTRRGQSSRTIFIDQALIEKIRKYIRKVRRGAHPGSPLFANESGYRLLKTRVRRKGRWIIKRERTSRMSYAALYRKIKRIARETKIENLRPHSVRHTSLTIFCAANNDIVATAKFAGHKNIQTTQRYVGVMDDSMREKVRKFSKFLTDNDKVF
jgi:integrase